MKTIEKMSPPTALHELFLDGLKDILWAEEHLYKALAKVVKAVTSDELKKAMENHREETAEHIVKVKQVFESVGEKPKAVKCEAMAGLIKEVEEMLETTDKGTMLRDAAIIIGAQKIEHYEIATYGSLATFAKVMKHKEAKDLLGSILKQEKEADAKLTKIAESVINEAANAETP